MADEYDFLNPVPGLKTDMELLLSHFTNSKSVRYAEFAKIWCQMGFPTIFCGWGKEESLREMIENALRMCVGFWSDIYTFQVRMGGLYLMYAFYFSQPLEPPQKVRLTQSQWAAGRKLLDIVRDQKHLDAEYIYHKMHYYRAFYYVMAPMPYQIAQTRRSYREDRSKKEIQYETPEPRATSVPNVFPSSLINDMESLHNHYEEMKSQFISSENIQEAEGLHTLKDDFYDILKDGLKHMESWRPGTSSFDPDSVKKITAAVVPTSPGQQGANRRRLKEHAFERSGIMGRHQRHLVLDSSQSSDSEKTFASPQRRPRKKKRVSEDIVDVSQEEIANASMPLVFDDDDDGKDNRKANRAKDPSSESSDDDAFLKAFNGQSTLSTSENYNPDGMIDATMEMDDFALAKAESKKGGKGKKTKQKPS